MVLHSVLACAVAIHLVLSLLHLLHGFHNVSVFAQLVFSLCGPFSYEAFNLNMNSPRPSGGLVT